MRPKPPRIAVRALLVRADALLLVNAFPMGTSDLWVAPGGGAEAGASLADNLAREVHEETGLTIDPGAICHIGEFHNPVTGFHQIEIYFRAAIVSGDLSASWRDPEGIVAERRFFQQDELASIRFSPPDLPALAFGSCQTLVPGPLLSMLAP